MNNSFLVDEKGWIPQNVEINAFFKPTLSKETLPFLQTKEEILNIKNNM